MPPPRPEGDSLLDQPHLRSTLVLRRGWWRHFVPELLSAVFAPAWVVMGWVFWWHQGRSLQLLGVVLLATAWGGYVGWTWGRRGLRRHRVLSSGAPTLDLGSSGIWIRHPFGPSGGCLLDWSDCAAVVLSRVPTGGRTSESYRAYVEFVPLSPDRVEGRAHPRDERTQLLDRPAHEVLTVWMELAGVGCTATEVAQWLRRWRPEVRVVDSLDRPTTRTGHSASTE